MQGQKKTRVGATQRGVEGEADGRERAPRSTGVEKCTRETAGKH